MDFSKEAQPDADAILHTSDDVHLYVIKGNLTFYSPVFRKMFEAAEFTVFADIISMAAKEGDLPTVKVWVPSALIRHMLPYCWPHFEGQLYHEKEVISPRAADLDGYIAALKFLEHYRFPIKTFQQHFLKFIRSTLAYAHGGLWISVFKKDVPVSLWDMRHCNRIKVAEALPWETERDFELCPEEVQSLETERDFELCPEEVQSLVVVRALKVQLRTLRLLKLGFNDRYVNLVSQTKCISHGAPDKQSKLDQYEDINNHLQAQLDRLLGCDVVFKSMADVKDQMTNGQSIPRAPAWSVEEGLAELEVMLFGPRKAIDF